MVSSNNKKWDQYFKMGMRLRALIFALLFIQVFGCHDEEENPLIKELTGTYEGVVNYHDDPIPGDDKIERLNILVTKHSNNSIKITTTFDLVLPVTGTFTTNGKDVVTLGAGKKIIYHSNGVEINSGVTDFNGWGQMCGYFVKDDKRLMITFGWTKGTEGGGGFIYGIRK